HVIALQPDGKILVGGAFTTLAGTARNKIGRLNGDGSIDPTFNPGATGSVWYITVQPDGKILVGSDYSFIQPTTSIRRLNADGSVDAGWAPPISTSGGGPFVLLPG